MHIKTIRRTFRVLGCSRTNLFSLSVSFLYTITHIHAHTYIYDNLIIKQWYQSSWSCWYMDIDFLHFNFSESATKIYARFTYHSGYVSCDKRISCCTAPWSWASQNVSAARCQAQKFRLFADYAPNNYITLLKMRVWTLHNH